MSTNLKSRLKKKKKVRVLFNHKVNPREYSWFVNRDCELPQN